MVLNLDALLDAVPERSAETAMSADAEVFLDGQSVKFRFSELDSRVWAKFTLANPPRDDVPLDAVFGYNVTAATEAAAPENGALVDGDKVVAVSAEQWVKLFRRLDGRGRQAITDAVFSVNEKSHIDRLREASNFLKGGSKQKRSSPER